MKEFTRVLTIEVTQVEKFGDEWAGDVEKDTLSEKNQKEAMEQLKRTFQADDIHLKTQLFIRDDVEDDGSIERCEAARMGMTVEAWRERLREARRKKNEHK